MKKSFIYVLMAAAALFTTQSLAACSDDDEDGDITDSEAEAYSSESTTDFIMEHIIIVDEAGDSILRPSFYGGMEDADHPLTRIYALDAESGETADSVFLRFIPDGMEKNITTASNGQKTFEYTEEGQTYSLVMTPGTGDVVATISLPDAAPYNKYVRTLELRNSYGENAKSLKESCLVGKKYRLRGARFLAADASGKITLYKTKAEKGKCPRLACVFNDGATCLLFYCPPSTAGVDGEFVYRADSLVAEAQVTDDNGVAGTICSSASTDVCYDYAYAFPTPEEMAFIHDKALRAYLVLAHLETCFEVPEKYLVVKPEVDEDDDEYDEDNKILYDNCFYHLGKYWGCNMSRCGFATKKTSNPIVGHKKVMYYNMYTGATGWLEKNRENSLNLIYVVSLIDKTQQQ